MIKEPGPVFCVGGGPKDVHHHEVLDVVLLPPWLFQLVDIVPELLKKSHLIRKCASFIQSCLSHDRFFGHPLHCILADHHQGHHKKLTTITIILHMMVFSIYGPQP